MLHSDSFVSLYKRKHVTWESAFIDLRLWEKKNEKIGRVQIGDYAWSRDSKIMLIELLCNFKWGKSILWWFEFLDNAAAVVRALLFSLRCIQNPCRSSVLRNHTEFFTNLSSFCISSNLQGLPSSIYSCNNSNSEPVPEQAGAARYKQVPWCCILFFGVIKGGKMGFKGLLLYLHLEPENKG